MEIAIVIADVFRFDTSNAIHWVMASVGAVLFLVVGRGLLRLLFRRKQEATVEERDYSIDVGQLASEGSPSRGPQLEFYGTPVRLAVLVLAPLGREGELPATQDLGELLNELVPELKLVIDAQTPIFRRWPAQLSAHGFVSLFAKNVRLPGDRGRGTPWVSVAGKFVATKAQYLVGMVLCGGQPNSYTAKAIEHPGDWATMLRVRSARG